MIHMRAIERTLESRRQMFKRNEREREREREKERKKERRKKRERKTGRVDVAAVANRYKNIRYCVRDVWSP